MNQEKLLSIIVPVYNIKNYIVQCIESVINQDFQNFELLLIDDGSTDGSGDVCEKYSEKYENVICYHKENGGVSSARNLGIQKAKGQYLMFIDGDDYLYENNVLNKIVPFLKYDIIQYKMIYLYEKNNKYVKLDKLIECNDKKLIEQLKIKVKKGQLSVSPCDKIIKRKILKENKLFFDEKMISAEDIDLSLETYMNIYTLYTLNIEVYVYRQQRGGSATSNCNKKNIDSLYYLIKKWYNYSFENCNIKNVYLNYLAYQYIILLVNINKKNCSKQRKKEIYDMKAILNYDENFKVKKSKSLFKVFGMRIGIYFLKFYLILKNKGIYKV